MSKKLDISENKNKGKFDILKVKNEKLEEKLVQQQLNFDQLSEKFSKIEEVMKTINIEKEPNMNETILDESIINLENSVKALEKELFHCSKCNFTTESKHGLKIQEKRKQLTMENLDYSS